MWDRKFLKICKTRLFICAFAKKFGCVKLCFLLVVYWFMFCLLLLEEFCRGIVLVFSFSLNERVVQFCSYLSKWWLPEEELVIKFALLIRTQ